MKADVAEYREFRLVISGAADGSLSLRVVDSPMGQTEEPAPPLPLDSMEARAALAGAARATEQWVQRNINVRGGSLDPLRDIGSRLFSWLFGPRLINFYQRCLDLAEGENAGLRLRLGLEAAEVMELPWEFLHDGSDFMALSNRTPVVRDVPHAGSPVPPPVHPPIRMLLVTAEWAGLYQLESTINMLSSLQDQGAPFELHVLRRATWAELLGELRDKPYHVLHYVGTGLGAERRDYRTSVGLEGLPLSDESGRPTMVPAQRWIQLLRDQDPMRLVCLTGGDTSRLTAALGRVLPAVLGVQASMTDSAAVSFAWGLYQALLAGKPLEVAVMSGRREVDLRQPGSREWGLPVFYMQTPTGEFLLPAERSAEKATVSGTRSSRQPPVDPKRQRQWKLLQSKLALAQGNLAALQQQRETKSGSPELVEKEIELTRSRIRDLEQQLDKMAT